MQIRKTELAAVGLAAVLLALMAGRAWGVMDGAELLRASAPAAAASETVPEDAIVEPEPVKGMAPPEGMPEGTSGAAAAGKVDLNAAGLEELTALPGIGEKRAQAILDWREEHGPFRYVEDLMQVPGIGEKTFAGLEEYVTVGGS